MFVLDAVLGGGEAGAIYRLTGSDLRKSLSFRDSMHQTDLADTLIFCELIGKRPEAVVLGMEPEDYMSMGTELSPTARKRLPLLCGLLRDELTARGLTLTERRTQTGFPAKRRAWKHDRLPRPRQTALFPHRPAFPHGRGVCRGLTASFIIAKHKQNE